MRHPLFRSILLLCASLIWSHITVDQFGYLFDEKKIAVIKRPVVGIDSALYQQNPSAEILLRDLQRDSVVFSGTATAGNNGAQHIQSGDRVWHFDFSEVTTSGLYRLEDPGSQRVSHPFEIRKNPWKAVLKTAGRTFFYQRIGIAKKEQHAGAQWKDGAAFLQDSATIDFFDQNNRSADRDLRGGWFDAGDYNKYVTFARTPVHELLNSYRLYPDVWGDDWNIPESGNGLPDLLDELKWELNWLLRMQKSDGSVIIKMGEKDYGSVSPPSSDQRPRYYGRTATSATVTFAAMCAHAALVYREFPEWRPFSDSLTNAARLAWDSYSAQPQKDLNADQNEIKSGDADLTEEEQIDEEAVVGAYMWLLTGEDKWNTLLLSRYSTLPIMKWWGPYNTYMGEALLLYATTAGSDATAAVAIKKAAANIDSGFKGVSIIDPWFAGISDNQYHWGSISVLSRVAAINLIQREYLGSTSTSGATFRERALDILHYIHGRNPLDKCYLSNMGAAGAENSVDQFYHSWFAHGSDWKSIKESEYGPAPGYVVGGPNKNFTKPNPYLPLGQPVQKMYADFNDSGTWPNQYDAWEITENAIYYQSAYLRLLSAFVNSSNDTLGSGNTSAIQTLRSLLPNEARYTLYNIHGKAIAQNIGSAEEAQSLPIPRGFYLLKQSNVVGGKATRFLKM